MISALFSSFGAGGSSVSIPATPAVQPSDSAKIVLLASATPHVAATLNASIARKTIQAILESSQVQKSGLTGRSSAVAEGESKPNANQISRLAEAYDEDEDDEETAIT